jgi:ATP-dependent Clp protease ATP-binding subunit ClpB
MDLNRLSMDLAAALETARTHAARRGAAYIQPVHLLAALLEPGGALQQLSPGIGLDAAAALSAAERAGDDGAARLEPGRQPIAGRALRDLLDRASALADRRGSHTVGPLEVALAATEGPGDLPRALRDVGWVPDRLSAALDSPEVMQPVEERGAPAAGALARFSRDLTAAAREGRLAPVVGRDAETRSMVQTLLRKSKNNPVLVGDPGTGKTAVVEGLALRMAAGDVPESLRGCRLLALDLTSLVAGAKYRGEFEERIKAVVDEVRERRDVVLFLDELHTLVGAGGGAGGMDAANILKPALARGELRCIGATTHDEYREHVEKDGALARRFEKVVVDEPGDDAVLAMLHGARGHYESHHGVQVTDAALETVVKLARRHLRDRFFPDKAFDVLDEAAARLRMQIESRPDEVDERERELARLEARLATMHGGAPERAALEAEAAGLRAALDELLRRWREEQEVGAALHSTRAAIHDREAELAAAEGRGDVAAAAELRYGTLRYLREQEEDLARRHAAVLAAGPLLAREVRPADVAEVVGRRAGVPVARMMEGERERLLLLEERLRGRVYGQEPAADALADAARRMRADLRGKRKPASFLFVGPTGVGKTELAKALAEALFDDETALVRIDMAEYKEAHSVSGLIGSRPGLVGSEQGGFLTEQVRRSPHSIVLFDEVEKAHPEVIDLLLGVLDEGRLTDARGRFCDFSNTLIILTSNLGVREANAASEDPAERKEIILRVVQASLRPELFNRLGEVIAFDSLERDVLERIVRKHLSGIAERLREQYGAELEADTDAVALLAELAYDPAYGARPVERTVERLVVSDLSRLVIGGDVGPGSVVRIVREGGGVALLAGTREEVDEEAARMAAAVSAAPADAEAEAGEPAGASA